MGFKNSQAVVQAILSLAGENVDSNETNKRIMYRCGGDTGHSLPEGTSFEVLLHDVSSWQFRLFTSATTGRDVLNKIQAQIDEDTKHLGVQKFIFCFDDRELVTKAKLRERQLREFKREKTGVKPYESTIELKVGPPVMTASYEYGLDVPLPKDFARVAASPRLLKRALVFLCELIEKWIVHPCLCSPTEKTAGHSCNNKIDITVQIVGRMVAASSETYVVKRFFFADQDPFAEKSKEKCLVGEAESQCFYYAKYLFDLNQAKSFLIRANDSDAVALGLLHLPSFFKPGATKFDVKIWIDTTSNSSERRLIDIVYLWRKLKKGLAAIPSRVIAGDNKKKRAAAEEPDTARLLVNDVETVVVVAMATGNDYCVGFPQLGPGTAFKFFKEGLVSPLKQRGEMLLKRFHKTGEMMINELALTAFIVYCYCSMSKVQSLLAQTPAADLVQAVSKNKHWPCNSEDQKLFFDELSAQQWLHGTRTVNVPNYHLARAHVRRAFFSLYYYCNVGQWQERKVYEFANDPITQLSVFGHKELGLARRGGDGDDEDAIEMIGLANKVWTHAQDGTRVQPFMRNTMEENQRIEAELSVVQILTNKDRRIQTDLTEEYMADQGTPNNTWTNPVILNGVDPKVRMLSGEFGSYLSKSRANDE